MDWDARLAEVLTWRALLKREFTFDRIYRRHAMLGAFDACKDLSNVSNVYCTF